MQAALSPTARKWIVNIGLIVLVILAGMAASDLWRNRSGKHSAGVLPPRLSCNPNQPPAIWEQGHFIFDFKIDVPVMVLNGSKKMYFGQKTWVEGGNRFFTVDRVLDVATGRITPKHDTLTLHFIEAVDGSVYRISLSSTEFQSGEIMRLTCLGHFQ